MPLAPVTEDSRYPTPLTHNQPLSTATRKRRLRAVTSTPHPFTPAPSAQNDAPAADDVLAAGARLMQQAAQLRQARNTAPATLSLSRKQALGLGSLLLGATAADSKLHIARPASGLADRPLSAATSAQLQPYNQWLKQTPATDSATLPHAIRHHHKNHTPHHNKPQLENPSLIRGLLDAAERYRSNQSTLSPANAWQAAIRKWVFDMLFHETPENWLARRLADETVSFTLADLRQQLSLAGLQAQGLLSQENLSASEKISLEQFWQQLINDEMPWLTLYENNPQLTASEPDSWHFAAIYAGSRYLADSGVALPAADTEAMLATGLVLWDMALTDGVDPAMLRYFTGPALFHLAQAERQVVKHADQQGMQALEMAAVARFLQGWQPFYQLREATQRYQQQAAQWLSREKLAEKLINDSCPEMMPDRIPWLNHLGKPAGCSPLPDDITEEYRQRTEQLAEHFAAVDEQLIAMALENASAGDAEFIGDSATRIQAADSWLRTQWTVPGKPGSIAYTHTQIGRLQHTDLLRLTRNGEERFYALKGGDQGYQLYRVDRDSLAYLRHGLFDHIPTDYRQTFDTGRQIKAEGEPLQQLVEYLKNKHQRYFANAMFESGYDPTALQKFWQVTRHFIPFYDCVEGIRNGEVEQAVPACLLDAVAFIPVAGQSARLVTKFGYGLFRGLSSAAGVFSRRALSASALRFSADRLLREIALPGVAELQSLALNSLRAFDPGFELFALAGRKTLQEVIRRLEASNAQHQLDMLIQRLKASVLPPQAAVSADFMAMLPHSQLQLPVKQLGSRRGVPIVAVINPETGEIAPGRYGLLEGTLHPLRETVTAPTSAPVLKHGDSADALAVCRSRAKRSLSDLCEPPLSLPLDKYGIYHPLPFTPRDILYGKTIFSMGLLQTLNPVRHHIVEQTLHNAELITSRAERAIHKWSAETIQRSFKHHTGFAISKAEANLVKQTIYDLHAAARIFNRGSSKRIALVAEDIEGFVASYSPVTRQIHLHENAFSRSHSATLVHAFLHEISHAVDTIDYFYQPYVSNSYPDAATLIPDKTSTSLGLHYFAHRMKRLSLVKDVMPGREFYALLGKMPQDEEAIRNNFPYLLHAQGLTLDEMSIFNADTIALYALRLAGFGRPEVKIRKAFDSADPESFTELKKIEVIDTTPLFNHEDNRQSFSHDLAFYGLAPAQQPPAPAAVPEPEPAARYQTADEPVPGPSGLQH